MAQIFPTNIAGFTTTQSLLINNLEIQTQDVGGFKIYASDPNNPLFQVNGNTGTITTTGTLNVLGTAFFNTIDISEVKNGVFEVASTNTSSDLIDIGLLGQYNAGAGSVYTAIFRNSADTSRRWFFAENLSLTTPVTNIGTITSGFLAGVVADTLSLNDGTASLPSFNFYSNDNTGLFRPSLNNVAISCNGSQVAVFSPTNFNLSSGISLATSTHITINDVASSSVGITSGSLTLATTTNADKWWRFISGTTEYSGLTLSNSTNNHYFITNTGFFTISKTTEAVVGTTPTDYRHSSKVDLLSINDTYLITTRRIIVPNGTTALPSYSFSTDTSTGMILSSVGVLSFVAGTVQALDVQSTYMRTYIQARIYDGTVLLPAVAFFNNNSTGIYRNSSLGVDNMSFSASGNFIGRFQYPTAGQFYLINGTTTYPALALGSNDCGLLSPQINGATSGVLAVASNNSNVWIFRNRTGTITTGLGSHECLNSIQFKPANVAIGQIDNNSSKFITTKTQSLSVNGYNLIDNNVVLFYRFLSSATIGTDSSESAVPVNGVVVGSPTVLFSLSDGVLLKKYILNLTNNGSPTDQYINLSANIAQFSSLDTFSVSFWFLVNTVPIDNGTIINFKNTVNSKNISISVLSGSDALEITVESDSITTLRFNTQGITIKDGLWHHLVLQLGTGGNKLFLDNVQLIYNVDLNYTSGGNGVPTADYATNTLKDLAFNFITIGGDYDGTTFSQKYTGYLYCLYITGTYLTTEQIQQLYTEGSIFTYSLDVANLNTASQSISGQLLLEDGSTTVPSIAFNNELNTGLYKIGTGNLGITLQGTKILDLNSTRLQNSGVYHASNGTVSLPAFAFTSAPNSGVFLSGVAIGIAQSGALKLNIDSLKMQFGANSADNYTLTGPSGSASIPTFAFIGSQNTGMYLISSGNLGISTAGTLRITVNSTATTLTNSLNLINGTITTLALNFQNTSGLYYATTNNAVNVVNNGVLTATFENPSTPRIVVNSGTLAVPSLVFSANTNNGFYASATTLDIGMGGVNIVSTTSSLFTFNIPISTTNIATSIFSVGSGTNIAPSITFTAQTGTGFFYRATGIVCGTSSGVESMRLVANTTSSGMTIGNITNTSTYTGENILRFAGLTGKQSSSFDYSVISERFWTGTTNSELLLFKNIDTTDRIRLRSYSHVFQTPTTAETYSTLADNNTALTIRQLTTFIGDTTSGSSAVLSLPNGAAATPALRSIVGTNTGLYFASNTMNVSNNGVQSFAFNALGTPHRSLNAFNVNADGTNLSVEVKTQNLNAIGSQLHLTANPVVEYLFVGTLSADSSVNNYAGATLGTTTAITNSLTLTDITGAGLINNFALGLTFGANAVYTNAHIATLANTSYLKVCMKILFTDIGVGATPANCWAVFGNYSVPATNFFRLQLTSGGVLNIIYTNATNQFNATYTGIVANTWYFIEVDFTSTGITLTLNNSVVALSYTVGNAGTIITPIATFANSTNIRAHIGGGINGYNAPACYVAYFSIIPSVVNDTFTNKYKLQSHEVFTNRLIVSGFPYNNSGSLREGSIAITNKTGELEWNNSIVVSSSAITLNKQLTTTILYSSGMIRYNVETSALTSIDLSSNSSSHWIILTSATVSITLPSGTSQLGRELVFFYNNASPVSLTINRGGTDNIRVGTSLATSIVINDAYAIVKLINLGAIWAIL